MTDALNSASSMSNAEFETMHYRVTDRGVAIVTIDVPGRNVNVLTSELHRELGDVVALLAADESVIGIVVSSGKKGFIAGGDLMRIVRYYEMNRSAADAYEQSRPFSRALRRLETCGKPVAVAINGSALGGGLELALACHYRVVADDENIKLGLPEVTLGLIPGAGGTQRLPRLIGLEKAVPMIIDGTLIGPAEALKLGMIDTVSDPDDLLDVAENWVLDQATSSQPWDRKGFRIPGGSKLNDMNIGRLFQIQTGKVGAQYRHNYPAPLAALRCLFNGSTVNSIDQGLRIESREFSALTRGSVARNIIRTLFINKRARKFRKDDADKSLVDACKRVYDEEGQRMLAQGLPPSLIRNAAWAAGMDDAPAGLVEAQNSPKPMNIDFDFETLQQRLLVIQSLAAVELWATEELDPVVADLSTLLGWGYPSYTGGVLSYVDTMGLASFVAMCDQFADEHGEHFRPSDILSARADKNESIYAHEA
jgi:3-hydroxyacyl-CoA dehydrogenase/enoyl-CoA hydratase/3-hydroxybutyryl-CoA epimerase